MLQVRMTGLTWRKRCENKMKRPKIGQTVGRLTIGCRRFVIAHVVCVTSRPSLGRRMGRTKGEE